MAAKVKCPGCGAKNAQDASRCRICTALLSTPTSASAASAAAVDESPAPMPEPSFDAGQVGMRPGSLRNAFGRTSGLGARLAAVGHGPAPASFDLASLESPADHPKADHPLTDYPRSDHPGEEPIESTSTEDWSPEALLRLSAQESTGAVPDRRAVDTTGELATLRAAFEPFDPNALFDAAPPPSDEEGPAAAALDLEPFDADALFRES